MKLSASKNLLTLFVTSALVACSSGGGGDTPNSENVIANSVEDDRPGLIVTGLNGREPESVNVPWLVNLSLFRDESATPNSGNARARLLGYGDSLNMLALIDFFEPDEPGVGECEVFIDDSPTGGGSGESGGNPPPRLGGGGSLYINTPLGVWAELESDGEAEPQYETVDTFPGAMPQNASLYIPGGSRFPEVEAYPVYMPEAPVRLSPDIQEWVATDALFSWMPGNKSGEFIALEFSGHDSRDGSFIEYVALCITADDGNFELTPEMTQVFDGYNGLLELRYYRTITRVDLVDDIAFYQRSRVSE